MQFEMKEEKMNQTEKSILESIDVAELKQLTAKLVAIDTQNPPADYSVSSVFMKALYEDIGLETAIFEGAEGKPNVGGRWQGDGSKEDTLLLSGHMDVVPAGGGWEIEDPLQVEEKDGFLLGRGVVDMKGSLMAQYLAVKALKKAGVRLKGDVYLFSTVDDETAGNFGLRYIVSEGWKKAGWRKPTFHILGEPTDLKLCVAFKGRMWIRITVGGKSAHGGNPSAGINAIEKMMKLVPDILAIRRLEHPLMGIDTINLGTIQGGTKTNMVADSCSLTIDYRYVTPHTSSEIEAVLKKVIADVAEKDPDFRLAGFEVFERREPKEVKQDLPAMASLKDITEEVKGSATCFNGVLSAGDSYWTISAGIPAAFFGPGSMSVAHTNKECVSIEELLNAAKIFALYIMRNLT